MAELSYEEMRAALQETKEKLHSRERRLRELGVDDWEPKPLPPPEKVVIKLCHHIRVNGKRCRGVATTGRDYCYFHLDDLGRRLKMARARARGQRWRLELPPLEDMYAVQVSVTQVIAAMADGQHRPRPGRRHALRPATGRHQPALAQRGVGGLVPLRRRRGD